MAALDRGVSSVSVAQGANYDSRRQTFSQTLIYSTVIAVCTLCLNYN